jgi:alkylated DNA nucleotide flippase Atl1
MWDIVRHIPVEEVATGRRVWRMSGSPDARPRALNHRMSAMQRMRAMMHGPATTRAIATCSSGPMAVVVREERGGQE